MQSVIGSRRRPHRGTTSLEVLVAFTLLSTVLTVSTSLVVKHERLLATQRDYRLALDELSNQLERLTALPQQELSEAVAHLVPSPFTSSRLPGAVLRGQLDSADLGQRLTLRLWWNDPKRITAPICMAAWILPSSEKVEQSAVKE